MGLQQMMLKTLQHVYRKHVLKDPDIGWEELEEELRDTLCEVMGDDEFVFWLGGTKDGLNLD